MIGPAKSMRRKRIASVVMLLLMIATAANHLLELGLLGRYGKLGMALVWIIAGVFLITNMPTVEEFASVRRRRGR